MNVQIYFLGKLIPLSNRLRIGFIIANRDSEVRVMLVCWKFENPHQLKLSDRI